jgi:hypothetical protein
MVAFVEGAAAEVAQGIEAEQEVVLVQLNLKLGVRSCYLWPISTKGAQ